MIKGDLVKYIGEPGLEMSPHIGRLGVVIKVDKDYYGASQAFKRYNWDRAKCINTMKPDGYGPTKDGIRDRALVMWSLTTTGFEYMDSKNLEIINEEG
jgi:hypothetical protein